MQELFSRHRRLRLLHHDRAVLGAVCCPVLSEAHTAGGDLVGKGLLHGPVYLSAQLSRAIGRMCFCRQRRPTRAVWVN